MTLCWGCGKPEESERFQLCTLCREEGLTSFFCGAGCFHSSWPRHKEWHREQRRMRALALAVAQQHWRSGVAARSAYDELLSAAEGMQLGSSSFVSSSTPGPAVSDVVTAAREYLRTVERSSASFLEWAEQITAAYALISQDTIRRLVPRPSWWEDDSLKAVSEQVLAARPDNALAWRMRGEVLCACLGGCSWKFTPRTAAELHEAGRCFQRAAALGVDEAPADRETVVKQAVACLRAAQAQATTEMNI
ncbi:MAG: hypothetical protein SGPRY_010980 [Prymnesium sp.]